MKELAKHVMEDLDSNFFERVAGGDFIVAGTNFGCGSSREQAPLAIKFAGGERSWPNHSPAFSTATPLIPLARGGMRYGPDRPGRRAVSRPGCGCNYQQDKRDCYSNQTAAGSNDQNPERRWTAAGILKNTAGLTFSLGRRDYGGKNSNESSPGRNGRRRNDQVIWQQVKDILLTPYIDLKTEYYDLGLKNRMKQMTG
jgi:hypothetical protein